MAASTYTTIQGDTWDAIAYRLWGIETLMHKLMQANPTHRMTVVFASGVTLTIPALSTEYTTQAMDPPWK